MAQQFFFRIAKYIADELIVKGLAESKSFQRFALRTAENLEKVQKDGPAHAEKVTATIQQKVGYFSRFMTALRAEVRKDIDKFSGRS
jgi:hypothetical protein